jgi:hypothetical protein
MDLEKAKESGLRTESKYSLKDEIVYIKKEN